MGSELVSQGFEIRTPHRLKSSVARRFRQHTELKDDEAWILAHEPTVDDRLLLQIVKTDATLQTRVPVLQPVPVLLPLGSPYLRK